MAEKPRRVNLRGLPTTERFRNHFPQQEKIVFSPSTSEYHPEMIRTIMEAFPGIAAQLEIVPKADGTPLYKAEIAEHVMLFGFITGDSWDKQNTEIDYIGAAHTIDPGDATGRNSKRFGVFLLYYEARQDARTQQATPEKQNVGLVSNQTVNTMVIAKKLSHVAGADYVVTVDLHSQKAAIHLTNEGLDHINITTAPILAKFIKDQGYLDDGIETILGTGDIGDLNRIAPLNKLLNLPIAVVDKRRMTNREGTIDIIVQKFIYGKENVRGKRVILTDDLISSGKTLKEAVNLYLKAGAKEIVILAPHAVFVDRYYDNLKELLDNDKVKCIAVANTLPFGKRGNHWVDIPHLVKNLFETKEKQEHREVQVMNLAQEVIDWLRVILSSDDPKIIKEKLGAFSYDMQNADELLYQMTGIKRKKPRVRYEYQKGQFLPLPVLIERAIVYQY